MKCGRWILGGAALVTGLAFAVHNSLAVPESVSASSPTRWLTILPPVAAIALALVIRNVLVALFIGIWLGAWGLAGWSFVGLWDGLLDTFGTHIVAALADPDHASVLLFSSMIGGMAGIVIANGGMNALAGKIALWARSRRRGQVATSLLGLAVFFDDYANVLVVGPTMQSVIDRLRISREKLAFLVDSTSAPVTCIAPISTWIGFEIGLVGTTGATLDGFAAAPYEIFLRSIAYSFYPTLMLIFVFLVAATGRDWGAMASAERAAFSGVAVASAASPDTPPKREDGHGPSPSAAHALIPVLVLIVSMAWSLIATGEGETLTQLISSGDIYKSMLWSSLLSALVAGLLAIGGRLLTLEQTVDAWFGGVKTLLYGLLTLILAWALSSITQELGTAEVLGSLVGDSIPVQLLPAIIFLLSATVSFSTGTAWGTMAVVLPIALPILWQQLLLNSGAAEASLDRLIPLAVASVLGGAVFGDHCSPISDTTVLSSTAAGCDHLEHVRTQMPYAVLVGGVAVVLGILPASYGWPWWLAGLLGTATLAATLRVLGRRVDA